jgi:hypothetical protein
LVLQAVFSNLRANKDICISDTITDIYFKGYLCMPLVLNLINSAKETRTVKDSKKRKLDFKVKVCDMYPDKLFLKIKLP